MQRQVCAFALGLATLLATADTRAVEGGLGRSITGLQVSPYVGIVPPDPGFVWQLGYVFYEGDIGGSTQTPIGGERALGLEAEMSLVTATAVYVWDTGEGRWNFASMFTLPYVFVDASADAVIANTSVSLDDDVSDFFDLYFAPLIASYHVSQVEHWSFGVYIYAPTASYTPGRLANPGLNNWTVSPGVGYTKLFSKGTLEFSALAAVDFYSENDETDYENGSVFRLDLLLMKRFASGWGVGAVGGWIEQVSEDEGPAITQALDGFEGRALGLGPAVSYSHKADDGEIDLMLRWVPEFDVEKRFEGDSVMLSATFNY
jgi:hypothetical protein